MSNTAFSDKAANAAFFDQLLSDDSTMQKSAMSSATEYTRMKLRETGFMRKIMTPEPVTHDDMDAQVDTDKPVIIVEKEPESPAAQSIPFGSLPNNRYIRGRRYRVMFDRIVTPNFTKDVQELGGYNMDIRAILSDNAIKDMLAEEDGKAISAVDSILLGPNEELPETGVAQWRTIDGPITRTSVAESLKILPRTPAHMEAATVLLNNISVKDFFKWGRDEVGGDLAEEIAKNGFGETTWFNVRHIITIKRDLVPDGTFYHFVEPKALGKFYVLEDATMAIERKFYLLNFFAYSCIGGAFGNIAGLARVDFDTSSSI
jgi:hypothetical protein